MKLEWFREHQGKFFLGTAILVIPGLVLFGASQRASRGGPGGTKDNPGVYVLDYPKSDERYIPGGEVFEKRLEWTAFANRPRQQQRQRDRVPYSTKNISQQIAAYQTVRALGIEVGNAELTEILREDIKEITGAEAVNPTTYQKMLDSLQLTRLQYERLMREYSTVQKYSMALRQAKLSDGDLYMQYLADKQRVRVLYQEFRPKDYLESAKKPTVEDVKKYYEEHKKLKADENDALVTDPKLAADVFFLPEADITKTISFTDEQLKKKYTEIRTFFFKKEVPAGSKPLEGEDQFKPFEEVKEQVRSRVVQDEVMPKALELMTKYSKELQEAAAEKKTVDLAAFAKERGLQYWRTKTLTKKEFKNGQEKNGAEDLRLAADLFDLAAPAEDPAQEAERAKDRAMLTSARRIMALNQGQGGFVALRTGEYKAAETMSLEQATSTIEKRLLETDAEVQARKAATDAHEKWVKGDGIPKFETLKEAVYTDLTNHKSSLAKIIYATMPAIGEILPVRGDRDEIQRPEGKEADSTSSLDIKYVLGFVVERKLPTFEEFQTDALYNKIQNADMVRQVRNSYLTNEGIKYLFELAKPRQESKEDPPLY